MLPAQPNQSLMDGLACLQALASLRDPVGSRELARLLDLEPTRTNRLLKTLAYLGLAEQTAQRKYRPGPAIHVLAAQSLFGSGLLQRALGTLRSLDQYGHIVALGVLWRDQTCYLYHTGPEGPPELHGLGHPRLYPAVSSGLGMALLATRPEAEIRAMYESPNVSTPTEKAPELDGPHGVLARLDTVRRCGYAFVEVAGSEYPNPRRLGVAVGNPAYAAIGFSGNFADRDIEKLVAVLHEAAKSIDHEESTP